MNPKMRLATSSIALFLTAAGTAKTVAVTTGTGDQFTLDVNAQETFFDVVQRVGDLVEDRTQAREVMFEVELDQGRSLAQYSQAVDFERSLRLAYRNGLHSHARDFFEPVSDDDRSDIHFILTTLANKPLTRILLQKSALERAGERIDHVHPLRFLQCVFQNEEMKAAMHNIRTKGKIWRDFFDGIRESLQHESVQHNMRDEFVKEFAGSVGLQAELIMPTIAERRWLDFLDTLLALIPRNKDHNRYDN